MPPSKGKAKATVPRRYWSGPDVTLGYFPRAAANEGLDPLEEDAWSLLAVENKSKISVEFDGRVIIRQGDKKALCTLTLNQLEYDFWGIKEIVREKRSSEPVTIILKVRGSVPDPTFTGKAPDDARVYPLAIHHADFVYIRLVIPYFSFKSEGGTPASTPEARIGHLKVLLTGQVSHDRQGDWYEILGRDSANLHEETLAQEAQLGLFKGCRLKTRKGTFEGTIVVEVYAGKPDDAIDKADLKDYDFDKKIGLSYWIEGSTLFPNDAKTLAKYKIRGSPVTEGWELVIVKDAEATDAAMIGTIRNTLGDEIDRFVGEDSNVVLEPIFKDILGMRSRIAVREVREEADEISMKAMGFFGASPTGSNDEIPKSQLPGMTLFSDQMCDEAENTLPGSIQVSGDVLDLLNEPQQRALQMILGRKVSIVWGPPGTGKSTTLAALVLHLLTRTEEKFVGTAMANVAVDALMDSCVKIWKRQHAKDGIAPPFVRVYSEAMIESQWQADDRNTLSNEFHIDQLRFKKASDNPERWGNYLRGRAQLSECGRILSEEGYRNYAEAVKELNADIIDNDVRGVFCTVAGCRVPALYEADPAKKKLKRFYKATMIINDEASTSLRPHIMLLAMTFLLAQRLVLAGDFKQLTALLLTDSAKKWWTPSFLQLIKEVRLWPYTLLDIQYRMHDALYEHLIKFIYKVPIRSFYSTNNPTPELEALMASMPLIVNTTRDAWKLQSFMHFIDVPGNQVTKPGGSSSNLEEVDFISAMVQSLVRSGCSKKQICVMTGYTDQKKRLQRSAKSETWDDIKNIVSFDSSQGSEADIIIISMVATGGASSFMANLHRMCVSTSRQKVGLYFVGTAAYWFSAATAGFNKLHKMLVHMMKKCKEDGRPSFVVHPQSMVEDQAVEDLADKVKVTHVF